MIDEKKFKKLQYISKSKMGLYQSCPMAFKFRYIDEIDSDEINPWCEIGIDVHEFIETFWDSVTIKSSGLIQELDKLKFHPNIDYKKNCAKFEIERWQKIAQSGFDESYFVPMMNEKKYITENPKLVGIVDRVHKVCSADPLAPIHSEFKDGDLIIIDNKTGKPNADKCKGYEEDLYWYKIIIEISRPELAPIKWGGLYFPYSNHVHHVKLTTEKTVALAKEIRKVRDQIIMNMETGMWQAKPSKSNCNWCDYKRHCNCSAYKG